MLQKSFIRRAHLRVVVFDLFRSKRNCARNADTDKIVARLSLQC